MVEFQDGVYHASGRIDSNTAKQFKEELKDAFTSKDVVLDFNDVEYISSAGLRVLLALKKECEKLFIVNANSGVYEIFELTGFTEMMKIEKALEEVSVEGCKVIGVGGTGIVYQLTDDMIVKVYNPGTTLEAIERERAFAKRAFIKGIPTAIPFGIVKVGECYGTRFEMLHAVTLAEALSNEPERFEELMEKYVNLIKHLQSITDEKHELSHVKDVLLSRIDSISDIFPKDMVDLSKELTNYMPDSDTIVHGDLHTNNVMVQNGELIIIDMADLTRGPKTYDMLCLFRDFYTVCSNPLSRDTAKEVIGVDADLGLRIWDYLIKNVYGIKDETQIAQIMGLFGLLTVVNCCGMVALKPREYIASVKEIMYGMFQQTVVPNVETIKMGMKNL